jgi:alkylated DNA repair dioxygenase AlkB
MARRQLSLFGAPDAEALPDGFRYQSAILSAEEERLLVQHFRDLPFKRFEYQGFFGKRRVVSFGWRYDFKNRKLDRADDIPDFLLPLRVRAAEFAGLPPSDLQQALVTEYSPGSSIGWHKDRPEFGEIVGISLLSPCVFRLRRKTGAKWERASILLEPRSAYALRGAARQEWQHSIPAVEALRYSLTFRTFRG